MGSHHGASQGHRLCNVWLRWYRARLSVGTVAWQGIVLCRIVLRRDTRLHGAGALNCAQLWQLLDRPLLGRAQVWLVLDSMMSSVGSHCECIGGARKCGSTARARINERLTAGLSTGEPLAPNGYHPSEHSEPFKRPAVIQYFGNLSRAPWCVQPTLASFLNEEVKARESLVAGQPVPSYDIAE